MRNVYRRKSRYQQTLKSVTIVDHSLCANGSSFIEDKDKWNPSNVIEVRVKIWRRSEKRQMGIMLTGIRPIQQMISTPDKQDGLSRLRLQERIKGLDSTCTRGASGQNKGKDTLLARKVI